MLSMWPSHDSNKIYWTSKPGLLTSSLSSVLVSESWRQEWGLRIPSMGGEGMSFNGQSDDGGRTNVLRGQI